MKKVILTILCIYGAFVLSAQQLDSIPAGVYDWNSLLKKPVRGSTTFLADFEIATVPVDTVKGTRAKHAVMGVEELIIVKDGQAKITMGSDIKTMGPGSIAYAMPGVEHGIENGGNSAGVCYLFKYKPRSPKFTHSNSFMINWNDLPVKKTEKGHRREFFNQPTSQIEKFEMHTTALNTGLNSHAPHTHKAEEIILILTGNVEMNINGVLYKANPGDIVFLPSQVSHNLTNIGNGQCEYFAFQWSN